jgi:hypothetical protein
VPFSYQWSHTFAEIQVFFFFFLLFPTDLHRTAIVSIDPPDRDASRSRVDVVRVFS